MATTQQERIDRTKDVLISMLREPTGRSILDSGGTPQYDDEGNYTGSLHGYGRAYERNQRREFDEEPEATVEFRATKRRIYPDRGSEAAESSPYAYEEKPSVDIVHGISTYHFLVEALEYSEAWDEFFMEWKDNETELYHNKEVWRTDVYNNMPEGEHPASYLKSIGLRGWAANEPKDRSSTHHLEDMEDFAEWLQLMGCKVRGLWGEGEPFVTNTYNGECSLDQTLQYLYMDVEDIPERWADKDLSCATVVLLQIHNGADVRGGYTAPRAFYDSDMRLFNVADGSIYCSANSEHSWYTDDSYHWYPNLSMDIIRQRFGADAGWREEAKLRLNELPAYEEDDLDLQEEYEAWRVAMGYDLLEPTPPEQEHLLGDEEHTADRNRLITKTIRDWIVEVKHAIPVDDDHNGYCPICGGLLLASMH